MPQFYHLQSPENCARLPRLYIYLRSMDARACLGPTGLGVVCTSLPDGPPYEASRAAGAGGISSLERLQPTGIPGDWAIRRLDGKNGAGLK